ncbi:late competence protein ComER [Paenibacillus yanchengensis]|uniref:Pyrroline-5-carboxylate reductase n=1 Tax=Paenibacillus yanchengensis TaxID=2035833 RepID=A0ABW4YKY9_9BACL
MKVGFIGVGTMGTLLVESFIKSGALEADNIMLYNRSVAKSKEVAAQFPSITLATSTVDIMKHCDIIFLCIRPLQFVDVLKEIKSVAHPQQVIVSITSPVQISHLEEELSCKIAKVIPSVTNAVFSGASLCMYSERMNKEDKRVIEHLFSYISEPVQIAEDFTRIVSDISSCGPAFFAFLLERFIDAAVSETGIDRADAERIASHMLLGTGQLLTKGGFSPKQVQQKVSVPGGITAEALRLLEENTEYLFEAVVRRTHEKYNDDLFKLNTAFYGKEVNGP